MMSLLAMVLATGAVVTSYDCTLPAPKALSIKGKVASLSVIGLPGEETAGWKFRIDLATGPDIIAKVVWVANPIQIAGNWPALPTGQGAYSFAAISEGPCLFTETSCMSIIQLIEQPDGSARIMVQPTAFVTDKATGTRQPFIIVAEGTCIRAGENK
jgi:hypothetical protein